jgi:hypothetical protein
VSASEDEVKGEIAGYRIEEKLARGRVGTVYKAKDGEGKTVAVRTFGGRLEPIPTKALERVEEVYKRLEQVVHSSVPRIIEQGKHEDRPYVVLQAMSGERLDRLLDEQRLPLEQVLALGKTLADALSAAHQVGLVHTDVCSRAILVGKDPTYSLLGWSAARPLRSALGKDVPRASLRPPDGEAPEALALPQLDVHGVGAILYEALAYAPPRPEDPKAPALLRNAWPPRRLNPTIRPDVEAVILKAIDPDARARYQSAAELSADLNALMDGKPVRALSGSLGRGLLRAGRRHPVVAGAAALGLALVLGLATAGAVDRGNRQKRIKDALADMKASLDRGANDRALAELEEARREDPDSVAVLEADAQVGRAKLESAGKAEERERAARLAAAESAARASLARARARREKIPELEERVRRAAARAEPLDQDGPEKRALQGVIEALSAASVDEARALGEALHAARSALALAPEKDDLKALLAEIELERCVALEVPRETEGNLRAFAQGAAATFEGKPRTARLNLVAEPQGATASVEVDGKTQPNLTLPALGIELPAGDALVSFGAAGAVPEQVLVHLEPGRVSRVRVQLVSAARGDGKVAIPGLDLDLPALPLPLGGRDVERAATAVVHAVSGPVTVAPALVARRPVTCTEYAAFVREKGGALPLDAAGETVPIEALDKAGPAPIVGITLEHARAYARWKNARLPSRAELWAARGRGIEGEIREWTDGQEGPVIVDLRASGEAGGEVVGDERASVAGNSARDLGFRLAESGGR